MLNIHSNTASTVRSDTDRAVSFFSILLYLILYICIQVFPEDLYGSDDNTAEEIRIGIFPFKPLNFIAKDGTAQGINPDLLREIFKDQQIHLSFVPLTWTEGLEKLQTAEIDLMPSMAFTLERSEVMDFSQEAVLQLWGQVFVRPEKIPKNVSDLFNQKVGIMTKDISGQNFQIMIKNLGGTCDLIEYSSPGDLFAAVKAGEVVAGIAPQHYGFNNADGHNLVGTSILFSPFSVYFSTQKGHHPLVLKLIDDTIRQWKQHKDSPYFQILDKWLTLRQPQSPLPQWIKPLIWGMLILAAVAIAFVILLNASVKRKTKALRESEKRFRDVVMSLSDWLWEVDSSGQIVFSSEQSSALLGYQPETLLDKSMFDLLDAGKSLGSSTPLSTLFARKDSFRNQEQIFRHRDGHTVHLSLSAVSLTDSSQRFKGFRGSAADITELVHAELEKKTLEDRLAQSQKMEAVGTLAGGIAHDFNNILAAILGYAELASDEYGPHSTMARYIEEIIRAGTRARELVNQILAFSRRAEISSIPLRPAHIVKEAIRMLRPSLPTTIEIRQLVDDTGDYIYANPSQLSQVVLNLSTNAFHAMEEKGGILEIRLNKVDLSREDLLQEPTMQPGYYFRLSISDSGHGIAPEIQDKIFDPYFTTKEQGKGTGMGLSLVHGFVHDFKGFLTCRSNVGEGTVFHVYLPIIVRHTEESPEESAPILGGNERVLCVDDEEMIVEMQKMLLKNLGYDVQITTDSEKALQMIKDAPSAFDAVITDQTMPRMTGVMLSEEILKIRPDLPIILCTGYSSIVTENKVKKLGVRELVHKPLAKKELAFLLRKVLQDRPEQNFLS